MSAYSGDFPPEPDSDEAEEDINRTRSFEEILKAIGLEGKFPGKCRLEEFLRIIFEEDTSNIVYLFWQKITCFDYRAGLPQIMSGCTIPCSMRDFIFSVLHCADDFLRGDIPEKLSACQLAVPILISGIKWKTQSIEPIFLRWACRRIMKMWKGRNDVLAVEKPIITHPILTVSFIRIGEVGMSKSQLVNYMLGPIQGNSSHPYFLTKEHDEVKPSFSLGTVESVWFLPNSNRDIFRDPVAFFNLRGDCRNYSKQRKFACKVANLTVVLVATNERKCFKEHIQEIKENSSRTLFISVSEREGASDNVKPVENWVFVKKNQIKVLSAHICRKIADIIEPETASALCDIVVKNIDIDETNVDIKNAKAVIDNICKNVSDQDAFQYKKDNFPLLEYWKELAQLYKKRFAFDTEDDKTFEQMREERRNTEKTNRTNQLECGLSNSVKCYLSSVQNTTGNGVKYFLEILHDTLFQMMNTSTEVDMKTIRTLEENKKKYKKDINAMHPEVDDDNNFENVSIRQGDSKERDRKMLKMLCTQCDTLLESCRVKTLGCEHFLREIGQQYEAYIAAHPAEHFVDCPPMYPSIAAELILHMHPFELMDGDTACVPITWVTSVLDALRLKLNDPKVLVLSVIGVQSSGKSTLFNSMFGLRFPVRAGKCTRGIFLRLLEIEEKRQQALGFKYLIVVDTEGLQSIDHDDHSFDNELVTFAVSIANVTMFNISGENIGSDVTGILQIAAHALMRMKEVDLECRCMIVQQRVSDLTAADRNKVNTQKIKEKLDEATKIAAEEEGLEGRYKEFSDVVDLRFDEDLQYVPSLWVGGMAPPNHMYGEKVTKIRNGLLRDIRNKVIIPELTLSTFTDRVRDVWSAVKEENFVFNFKDSVRAVDFNQFCLHYNEWIVEMRQAMMNQYAYCIVVIPSKVTSGVDIEFLKTLLHDEAELQLKRLRKLVKEYILNHPRNISKYKKGFIEDIGIAVKDTRKQAILRIQEEYDIRKLEHNLPNLGGKWLVKMIKDVKEVARTTQRIPQGEQFCHKFDTIDTLWKTWTKDIKQESGITQIKISSSDIKTLCNKLLLRMTRDMAIGSDIHNLLSNEGGIEKHIELSDCKKYINNKHAKAWIRNRHKLRNDGKAATEISENIQTEKQKAITFMEKSVEERINEIKRQGRMYFDRNVFHLLVRKTLTDLSKKTAEGIKLPSSLIAKGLMHLSGRAFHEVYQHIATRNENFSTYFPNEDAMMMEQLDMFETQEKMEECAAQFVFYYMEKVLEKKLEDFKRNLDYSDIVDRLCLPWDVWRYGFKIGDHTFIYFHSNSFTYSLFEWCDICFDDESCLQILCDATEDEILPVRNVHVASLVQLETHTDWINRLLSGSDIDDSIRHIDELYNNPRPLEVSRRLKEHIQEWGDHLIENCREVDIPSIKIAAGLSNVCGETCPMCGTFCDNIMESHNVHSSHLHRPRGMTHETYPGTNQLVSEDCSASILLPGAMYTLNGEQFHCKDYKQHCPDWDIRPSTNDPGKLYWQWHFVSLKNHYLFNGYTTNLPESWLHITEEEALKSLEDDKILKTRGRSKQDQSNNETTTIGSETKASESLVPEESQASHSERSTEGDSQSSESSSSDESETTSQSS